MEQEAAQKETIEEKEEERARIQEKRDVYDKYVKEMHWPKVSDKKRKELEALKANLKTSPLRVKKSPKSIMGSDAYQGGDEISSRNKYMRASSDHDAEKSTITRRNVIWPENTMKPKPREIREGKIVDWLKEQRIKHEEDRKNGHAPPIQKTKDWKKDYDKMDLTGKDKYDMFIGKAKDFEEKAKRKQEIIGVTKGATIEDIIELNDMYVESIKAKLELLNDFK